MKTGIVFRATPSAFCPTENKIGERFRGEIFLLFLHIKGEVAYFTNTFLPLMT